MDAKLLSSQRLARLLRRCRSPRAVRRVHQQIIAGGHLHSAPPAHPLGARVAASYLACGAPSDALLALQRLPAAAPAPVFLWNLLLRRCLDDNLPFRALAVCRFMLHAGASPDHYTLPLALKASAEIRSHRRGAAFHAAAARAGFERDTAVGNAILTMYDRCGSLESARKVFSEITDRGADDVVSWNSIVAAHAKADHPLTALKLFKKMTGGFKPDIVAVVNVLPACAALKALDEAAQLHGYAVRSGIAADLVVGGALIDVYAKCGEMEHARRAFNLMDVKDIVSWNAVVAGHARSGEFDAALELVRRMRHHGVPLDAITWTAVIAACAQQGHGRKALEVFRQMLEWSPAEPNAITVISVLSACAAEGAIGAGMELHAYSLKRRLMMPEEDDGSEEDFVVPNALIDMYAKCGSVGAAETVFRTVPPERRTVVTWTVMLGGHAQHGDAVEALRVFRDMVGVHSVSPNDFALSHALTACGRLSALNAGKQIHAYVMRRRFFDGAALHLGNCFVDMYSKCGTVDAARSVFDGMPVQNGVSWTSLITGYGVHGRGVDALRTFDEMTAAGLLPDEITFRVVLYACSHSGMVDRGIQCFEAMQKDYGLRPSPEHYACAVDLLGRAGRVGEAMAMIRSMPAEPPAAVWMALLSACRGGHAGGANIELAELAAGRLAAMGAESDGSNALLANVYASAGKWDDVASVRRRMKSSGGERRPGMSWVEERSGGGVVEFFAGDRRHPMSEQIRAVVAKLKERIEAAGYAAETAAALHDVDEEEKAAAVWEHSEKLALGYALLTAPAGSTAAIRITKNLRFCGDCHSAFEFVSGAVGREIVVRDPSRFHHFSGGRCSCGGR